MTSYLLILCVVAGVRPEPEAHPKADAAPINLGPIGGYPQGYPPIPPVGLGYHTGPIHPTPCYGHDAKVIYSTILEQVPVYQKVYETRVLPTTFYKTVYETQYVSKYVTQPVPEYITKVVKVPEPKYITKHNTVYRTEYKPKYVTETKYQPVYRTKVKYETVYHTKHQPKYITKTNYRTKAVYETKYVPRYETKVVYKTVCPKQGYAYPATPPTYEGYGY